ncbi:MAG: transposase [Bacteroidota bacterium]
MSRKYNIRNDKQLYFVSPTVVFWVDVFTREVYSEIILESLRYCQQEKGLEIYAWCIMPSHLHLIIGSSKELIAGILRDFKAHTSRQIKKAIREEPAESRREWMQRIFNWVGDKNSNNKNWQFWQQHNHPIELSTNDLMERCLAYIHQNPVTAGFVDEAIHWRYSSAQDYEGQKGLLEVLFIE